MGCFRCKQRYREEFVGGIILYRGYPFLYLDLWEYDNINNALGEHRPMIQPVNLFICTKVNENGIITINPPVSKARDKIIFQASMDMRADVAACSVSEGECNNRKCTSIKAYVED